jgi:hypothetical protein
VEAASALKSSAQRLTPACAISKALDNFWYLGNIPRTNYIDACNSEKMAIGTRAMTILTVLIRSA